MASIPESHSGVAYFDFVAALSQKRGFQRYLEIGVSEGQLMSLIHADLAVGVDPEFKLKHNVIAHKKKVHLFNTTSDSFFASPHLISSLNGKPDFSFLDGYHTFEYLLRDFMNTEALCDRRSMIAMHDCLPLDDVMIERDYALWQTKTPGTKWQYSWTGDVWKVILILKRYRPDLQVMLVDCPPTGVVCVTNLDPSSTILRDNYLSIVRELLSLPNDLEGISRLYDESAMVSSRAILNGMDHSLFFVT